MLLSSKQIMDKIPNFQLWNMTFPHLHKDRIRSLILTFNLSIDVVWIKLVANVVIWIWLTSNCQHESLGFCDSDRPVFRTVQKRDTFISRRSIPYQCSREIDKNNQYSWGISRDLTLHNHFPPKHQENNHITLPHLETVYL